jgi:periplasmic protein CpxP/Spy
MKHRLLNIVVAGALFTGAAALAQEPAPDSGKGTGHSGARHGGPRSRAGAFLRGLNLTPEQKQKIQPLLQDQTQKARAVFNDTTLSDEDRWTRLRDIRQQTRSQILPILTAEQQQKLAEREQQRKQHQGGRAQERGERF